MKNNNAQKIRNPISSLEEVMKYENIDVIERFMTSWDLSLEQSTDVFNEMKKWLWLCADNMVQKSIDDKQPRLAITASMTLLDEMWHAFILFTRPYTSFCTKYFGFYIHHGPSTNSEKEEFKTQIELDSQKALAKIEADLTFQYEYIYERLGEGTLKKWYSDWTDLYTPEYLNKIYTKKW